MTPSVCYSSTQHEDRLNEGRARKQTATDWGTFPGQSIGVGPCGPGEHNSKLIRSRRPRQAQHSTGRARDGPPLLERFTLEAKGERLLIPPAIGT